MAEPQSQTLERIRQYVSESRAIQDSAMDIDAAGTEARLERTLQELQARVQEQRTALENLRASSGIDVETAAYASHDPHEKLKQLLVVKDAYNRLTLAAPFLPSQDSVLPALLAARTLHQNVQGTKDAIKSTQDHITSAQALLRREEANLHDANLLTRAMESRIEKLRIQQQDRSQKTPAQLARELINAKRTQKDAYDGQMQSLGEAMNVFVNDYLSAMLAAEELGGPVVGEMLDVEDQTLAAGFTKHGKTKSTKKPVSDKMRQRRIDHIWGTKAFVDDGEDTEEPLTEAEAADTDMRQLIENLFATLMGPGGGKAYYGLERDSAASRFLVRAKVAQFHPKDAKKLRLIDFGRELDD